MANAPGSNAANLAAPIAGAPLSAGPGPGPVEPVRVRVGAATGPEIMYADDRRIAMALDGVPMVMEVERSGEHLRVRAPAPR